MLEKQLLSFDPSNNTSACDVKMSRSVLDGKPFFKMLGLSFFSNLDWGSLLLKLPTRKLVLSMKFRSSEDSLYLYKSTIQPYMEYCCHVYAGMPSCYLEMLDKLQKLICRVLHLLPLLKNGLPSKFSHLKSFL